MQEGLSNRPEHCNQGVDKSFPPPKLSLTKLLDYIS